MAITTPDAVPGEVIEAAWGDAVRTDLNSIDTIARAAMPKSGGTFTGNTQHGGSPGVGAGVYVETVGRIHTSVVGAGSAGLPNLMLARASNPGAGAPNDHIVRFYRGISISNPFEVLVGSVALNAGANGVVYNTSSDKRLKSVTRPVVPAEALEKLRQIEPVHYVWNSAPEPGVDRSEQIGFLAQDLHVIAPEAVTPGHGEPGEPDFIPWGIDVSRLVPTLVAAVQALAARLTALEAST